MNVGNSYDIAIIGAGIGGLTAGALLAKAGKRVIVVEKNDRPGGCAQSFRRGDYIFDSCIHLTEGCGQTGTERGDLIRLVLESLGVQDSCPFIPLDPMYRVVYPDVTLDVSKGIEPFIEVHAALFPKEKDNLARFLRLCQKVSLQARKSPIEWSLLDMLMAPIKGFSLVRFGNTTLKQVLDHCFKDDRLKTLVSSICFYLALPPSLLSFVIWSVMFMSFILEGAYYCRGTFQMLASTLAKAINEHGGKVLYRSKVIRISMDNGRATGIMLEGGEKIPADIVVANTDPLQVFNSLIEEESLTSRYKQHIKGLRPSMSAFVVYAVTNSDPASAALRPETFLYDSWDHENHFKQFNACEPKNMIINIPSMIDSSLIRNEKHTTSITTMVPYQKRDWRREKTAYADQIVKYLESRCPPLIDNVQIIDSASPLTIERYTKAYQGALVGWDLTPKQSGRKGFPHRTPVSNLYITGQWSKPAGGILGVTASGFYTAQQIIGYKDSAAFRKALMK